MNVAPPDTLSLIQDAFAPARQIGGHFGMTECAGAITCNVWDATRDQQAATCGAPVPGVEVRVVDPETGGAVGAGRRAGSCRSAASACSTAITSDPEATAASFTADGWLRSGDAGQIDADGW